MKNLIRAVAGMLALTVAMEAGAQSCVGDVNSDGRVDGGDLGTALAWWGPVVTTNALSVACDLDGSGQIDGADLGLLLSNWGVCVGSIASVTPLEGCAEGGTAITINGAFLESTSAVSIGGRLCTGVVVRSATQVEAVIPSGVPGSAAIRVTTGAGTFEAPLAFSYSPASIATVSPNQGCVIGGTQLTITGACLGGTTAVTVGGIECSSVTVLSPTTISAVTPAGTSGTSEVRVATPASTAVSAEGFTYLPPTVSSISPNGGPTAGGSPITISGAYLALTTGVTIGGAPCASLTVVNATTVTAVTPAGAPGNADVVITGGKGTITIPGGYRYVGSAWVPAWATLVEAQPDPAVVTDAALRAKIAETGLAWRVRDSGTQMEMVLIPPDTFPMGCFGTSSWYGCASVSLPMHWVTRTTAFYLGRFEVTQAQWVATMGSNPSYFQGRPDSASRPVESVSWDAFQGYLSATGFRLPTEAEWEYACRAGTLEPFYNGSYNDNTVVDLGWYGANSGGETHAVGGKAANGFGLYDMLGNVWEWVNDWWYPGYPSSPQTNPTGPASGGGRVMRGGSCLSTTTENLRSSYREYNAPCCGGFHFGFRVARNP
jgi:formylglycine-generating enzyme required for sulfatase activity